MCVYVSHKDNEVAQTNITKLYYLGVPPICKNNISLSRNVVFANEGNAQNERISHFNVRLLIKDIAITKKIIIFAVR